MAAADDEARARRAQEGQEREQGAMAAADRESRLRYPTRGELEARYREAGIAITPEIRRQIEREARGLPGHADPPRRGGFAQRHRERAAESRADARRQARASDTHESEVGPHGSPPPGPHRNREGELLEHDELIARLARAIRHRVRGSVLYDWIRETVRGSVITKMLQVPACVHGALALVVLRP